MKKILVLLLASIVYRAYSQQDILVTQYMFNHAFINPAAVGVSGKITTSLMYRKQWAQFSGAPTSQFLSVDGPIKAKNMGLGLLVQNENIGVNHQTDLLANYSYIINMNKAKLSFGLRAGMTIFNANYSDHIAWDTDDNVLLNNTTAYLPNFGFGVYYKQEKFYASISIPHLLSYDKTTRFSSSMDNSNQSVRHYYFMGGYNIDINDNIQLQPSVLFKYAERAPAQADFNLMVAYKKILTLGGGYRTGDSFVALCKLQLLNNVQFGYSYDITLTSIRNYSSGSHEVMLNYILGKKDEAIPSFF